MDDNRRRGGKIPSTPNFSIPEKFSQMSPTDREFQTYSSSLNSRSPTTQHLSSQIPHQSSQNFQQFSQNTSYPIHSSQQFQIPPASYEHGNLASPHLGSIHEEEGFFHQGARSDWRQHSTDQHYGGRNFSHGNHSRPEVVEVSGKPEKQPKAKATTWTMEDDIVLVKAWFDHSTDPIHGTSQKGIAFWEKIKDEVNRCRPKCSRSIQSCKSRWTKIHRSISKYIGCELRANSHYEGVRSGGSPDDVKDFAKELFAEPPNDLGEFDLFHVLDLCKDEPKFLALHTKHLGNQQPTFVGSDGDDFSPRVSTMDLSSDDGTPTFPSRPPGTKQAKMKKTAKAKGKGKSDGSNSSAMPVMPWMSMFGDASKLCNDMVEIENRKLEYDLSQRDVIKGHQEHEIALAERRHRNYRSQMLVQLLKKNDLTPAEQQMKEKLVIELM